MEGDRIRTGETEEQRQTRRWLECEGRSPERRTAGG